MSAVQLEQPVNSRIYDARQQVTAADEPHRVSVDFLRSPTAAVIESALLMLLIGWIDYKTTDFAFLFRTRGASHVARRTQSGLVYRNTEIAMRRALSSRSPVGMAPQSI